MLLLCVKKKSTSQRIKNRNKKHQVLKNFFLAEPSISPTNNIEPSVTTEHVFPTTKRPSISDTVLYKTPTLYDALTSYKNPTSYQGISF